MPFAMHRHRAPGLLVGLLLGLGGCPGPDRGEPPRDAAAADGVVADMCGTLEGLDDPPVFVGSCVGAPDSSGTRGCVEFTTRPYALGIGTPCLVAGCLLVADNAWSPGACGSDFVRCSEIRTDDGLVTVAYSTDPASCPPAP